MEGIGPRAWLLLLLWLSLHCCVSTTPTPDPTDIPAPGTDEVQKEICYPCEICYILLPLALVTVFLIAMWQAIKLCGRSTALSNCCQMSPPPFSSHATQLHKPMQCPQLHNNHVSNTTTPHQTETNKLPLKPHRPLHSPSLPPTWDPPQRPYIGREERHPSLASNMPVTNSFHDSSNSIYGDL